MNHTILAHLKEILHIQIYHNQTSVLPGFRGVDILLPFSSLLEMSAELNNSKYKSKGKRIRNIIRLLT